MLFLTPFAFSILTACGQSGPDQSELEKKLGFNIPAVWKVAAFSLEAMQNFGTEVEPQYKGRFKAELELKDNTFAHAGRVKTTTVLRPVLVLGHRVTVYGTSTSTLSAGQWKTSFDFEGQPFHRDGQPKSAFSGPTVIANSDQHMALVAEAKAAEAERRAAAEAKARARRQAEAEAEKKYLNRAKAHFTSLENVFSKNIPLNGIEIESRTQYPFRIDFTDYNAKNGEFQGRITYLQSGSIIAVSGKAAKDVIRFVQTAWIHNPKGSSGWFSKFDGKRQPDGIFGITCRDRGKGLDAPCRDQAARFSLQLSPAE